MKKKLLTLFVLSFLVFGLAACKNKSTEQKEVVTPETGNVVDVSDKNTQEVTVTPGDVLYLKLIGKEQGMQWMAASPTSSDCITLKNQTVEGLNQPKTDAVFQWWIKIEKTCTFNLQFDYSKIKEAPATSFKVKVISQ